MSGRSAGNLQGSVLILASVMPIMAIISLVPILPLLLEEYRSVSGSEFLVPIALTVPALCVAVFSPFAGWLADRVGRKSVLIAALVLYAAAGTLPVLLTELPHLIASRIALGIMEAVIMTVATTLIGDYFQGQQREKWLATQVAAGSVAAILLVAIGGTLGEVFGSRGPFFLYLLALPIAALAAVFLFEPHGKTLTLQKTGNLDFPWRATMPLVLLTLGVGVLFYTVIVQLGPVLHLAGPASPALIGAAGAAANLGVALGSFVFRRASSRSGASLLATGLVLAGIGYAGASMGASFAISVIFVVIACLGSGLMLPTMLTWIMRVLPLEMRGRGTGIWTGAFFLGQFVAPIVATGLSPALGGLGAILQMYAGLALIGAAVAWFVSRSTAQNDQAPA